MLGSKVTSKAAALSVVPTLHALPEVCKLHILSFGTPRCALRLEAASPALDLRAVVRTAYDALWSGHLRECWPCEGPALCSLVGPQATARQLYEAFATRRVAQRNITQHGQQVEAALHRVAFILTIGRFARTARFGKASPDQSTDSAFGRIQPGPACLDAWDLQGGEALFDFASTNPPNPSQANLPHWDPVVTREATGNQLSQSLYAIDLQSSKCVTLFENNYPDDIGLMSITGRMCIRYFGDSSKLPTYFQHAERLLRIDAVYIDLDRCVDAGPFVYRLRHTDIFFRCNGGCNVGDREFCPYLVDIIQQTHAM